MRFPCTAGFRCRAANGQMKINRMQCVFSMDRCGDRTFVLWSVSVFKWFDGNGGGNYSLFFVIFLILIPVFITGGIHLDGFLDTQDALSSWQTKERRLEILKEFPRRSICYHFMYRLFSDVYWRVFLSECTEYGSDRI